MAQGTMTSGVSHVESRATGCKAEMGLDSFGTVRECGEEEAPPAVLSSGASLGHASPDTARARWAGSLKDGCTRQEAPSLWPSNMFYGLVLAQARSEVCWPGTALAWSPAVGSLSTWLHPHCLCFGIWLNGMPGIRV